MNVTNLISSSDVIKAIFSGIIGFVFAVLLNYIVQSRKEKRERSQITFAKTSEKPLSLAKDELKDRITVLYQGAEIKDIYSFNLKITNTGKKTIKKQGFTCLFSEKALSLDPTFPKITTTPPREVGPIVRDTTVNRPNEFRYVIETIGVGQLINIDFITVNNETLDFQVIFQPNEDVMFVEGDVSGDPDIEMHFTNLATGLLTFVVLQQVMSIFPIVGAGIGAIIGLPFLFRALRSLGPSIKFIIRNMRDHTEGYSTLIDAKYSQGFIHKPNGEVSQHYSVEPGHILPSPQLPGPQRILPDD
jgi:hypothetical protein